MDRNRPACHSSLDGPPPGDPWLLPRLWLRALSPPPQTAPSLPQAPLPPALSRRVHDLCDSVRLCRRRGRGGPGWERASRVGTGQQGTDSNPGPPASRRAAPRQLAMLLSPNLQQFHSFPGSALSWIKALSGPQPCLFLTSLPAPSCVLSSCPSEWAPPSVGWGPAGHMVLLFGLGEGWP